MNPEKTFIIICLVNGFELIQNSGKCVRILKNEICEHLAVNFYVVGLKLADERSVGKSILFDGLRDSRYPELPEIAFSHPSTCSCIFPGVKKCLLGHSRKPPLRHAVAFVGCK